MAVGSLRTFSRSSSRARSKKASKGCLPITAATSWTDFPSVVVPLVDQPHHQDPVPIGPDIGPLFYVPLHGDAGLWVPELGGPLFPSSDQGLYPAGHVIEEVELRQLELKPADGALLLEHQRNALKRGPLAPQLPSG